MSVSVISAEKKDSCYPQTHTSKGEDCSLAAAAFQTVNVRQIKIKNCPAGSLCVLHPGPVELHALTCVHTQKNTGLC